MSKELLLGQVDALSESLKLAERWLDDEAIESTLRAAVRHRFGHLISRREQELKMLRQQVEETPAEESFAAHWHAFRHQRVTSCEPLFAECLAYIEGALLRTAKMDNEICRVADCLLADLSDRCDIPWKRFTIMGEGEFFAGLSEIIRVRFRDFNIWHLPVAAHEFGHFVLESRDYRPLVEMILQAEGKNTADRVAVDHLHEQFADTFATFVLGPAYAFNCIMLRFDPTQAHMDRQRHPSDAKRAHAIIRVLRHVDEADKLTPMKGMIEHVEEVWKKGLESADQHVGLSEYDRLALEERIDRLLWEFDSQLGRVRYSGWSRAAVVEKHVASEEPVSVERAGLTGGGTVADILNGAWLARVSQCARQEARIGDRAMQLCVQFVP